MAHRQQYASSLRRLCLLLAIAVVFQLFYLGSQPFAAGLVPAPWDKLAHFAVYSTITFLLWISAGGDMAALVIAIVIVIGALDELHQAYIPGRHAEIGDFLTDTCAAISTVVAVLLYARANKHGT